MRGTVDMASGCAGGRLAQLSRAAPVDGRRVVGEAQKQKDFSVLAVTVTLTVTLNAGAKDETS